MKISEARYCVIDTETTGFSHEADRIVQIGAVRTDWMGKVMATFEALVSPGRPIPPDASAIHHITDDMVADAKPLPEVLKDLDAAIGPFDVFVAHNAPFDAGFVKPPAHIKILDTVRLAQKCWPGMDSYKNQFLRYYFKLKVPGAEGQMAHSALPDALVTTANFAFAMTVLRSKAKGAPEDIELEEVLKWLEQPMDIRTSKLQFGKYRGKTWEEVARMDSSYLTWCLNPDKCSMEWSIDQKFTMQRLLGRA